jgi:hypothetical protein
MKFIKTIQKTFGGVKNRFPTLDPNGQRIRIQAQKIARDYLVLLIPNVRDLNLSNYVYIREAFFGGL